jgi:hypothetical protein
MPAAVLNKNVFRKYFANTASTHVNVICENNTGSS